MPRDLSSNKRIQIQIERMLNSDFKAHAFLFTGGSKSSRFDLGMWLCEKILCSDEVSHAKFLHGNHEDFILLEKPDDRESIVKDQILELLKKIDFKPYGDKYAVLIKDADLMNEIAQNKLLKGLEEPNSQTVFVLLSERDDALLSTIKSRCTSFMLEEDDTVFSENIKDISDRFTKLILNKAPYFEKRNLLSSILDDKDNSRKLALEFLDSLELSMEKILLSENVRVDDIIKSIELASMYLKQGHSVAYTLKQFCLRV